MSSYKERASYAAKTQENIHRPERYSQQSAPPQDRAVIDFRAEIDCQKARERVAQVWPGKRPLNIDRFFSGALRSVYTTGYKGSRLRDCDLQSIKDSLLEGAEEGLYTDDQSGEFDLVPRSGSATMQINYRGWHQKAMDSGRFNDIWTDAIYENDQVVLTIGHPSQYQRTPDHRNPGPAIAYVCYAEDRAGRLLPPMVMTVEQINAECREHSDGYKKRTDQNPGPWITHPDQMNRKSVLMKFCKQFPELNTDRGLVRDEYREAGFEQISDVPVEGQQESIPARPHIPPVAPAAATSPAVPERSAIPTAPPSPGPTATGGAIPQQQRQQPAGPFREPPPVVRQQEPVVITPAQAARLSLIQQEIGEVLHEFALNHQRQGEQIMATKARIGAEFFPAGCRRIEELSDLDCHLLADSLCHAYDKEAVAYPPKMDSYLRNHAEQMDLAIRDLERRG